LTLPENGTVSFTYNGDGTVLNRTDAKGQRIDYTYDANKRVLTLRKYGNYGFGGAFQEDTCQAVTFTYDTNAIVPGFSANLNDRPATASYFIKDSIGCEAVQEMYSYTPAGAMTKKRVRLIRGGVGLDLDVVYTYDTEGRVASVAYPNGGATLQQQYDTMGRLSVVRENKIRDGVASYVDWANNAGLRVS